MQMLPHVLLFLAMITWSSSFIAIKIALGEGLTPSQLMTLRMLTAVLLFIPVIKPAIRSVRLNGQWTTLCVMLFCEPCLYFLFETQALRFTSASQAGMVSSVLPLTVAVTALLVLKERTTIVAWLGFGIAAAGVVWLTLASEATETAPDPVLGNLLEGIAMICGALYTVCLKKLSTAYDPFHLTAMQAMAGFLFFLPQACLEEGAWTQFADIGWTPVLMAVYLGSVVTFCGYGLYNYGVSRISAGQAGAYTNLMPVMTLCFGVWLLDDVFLPNQYAASLLVVVGIGMSQYVRSAPPGRTNPA